MAVLPHRIDEAKILAFGQEVVANPAFLAGFRDAFSSDDPVRLVVLCPPEQLGLTQAVELAAKAAGLDGDGGAGIVLLQVPDDAETRRALADAMQLVFSEQAPQGELSSLRHIAPTGAETLRRAAERVTEMPPQGRVTFAPAAPAAAEPKKAPASSPSFLLVTYDSCRYDVLCEARTPNLDRYAKEIHPAQTPANFTYGAHHAFFAGMLPHVELPIPYYNRFVRQLLGLAKVGEGELVAERALKVVPSKGNVVSGLREAGYQTVGAGAMNWFQQDALTCWFEKFAFTDTDAEAQVDFVLREVDVERPFFAFVNFGETHDPFGYKGKQTKCSFRVQSRLMEWPPVEKGLVGRNSEPYWHQIEAVEFLDRQLPRLFGGLPGDTIVVLCGDHGEAFGEDGYWGHAINHPKVQEVPIAIFKLDGTPLAG